MFQLLQMLYENNAEYDKVIEIFSDTDTISEKHSGKNKKTTVILNKYLNTLRVFGINVKKIKKHFVMRSGAFSLNFDMNDIKSVYLLSQFLKILPDGKTKKGLEKFVDTIESRFDDEANLMLKTISTNNSTDFSFYYLNLREQLERCEEICQDKFKINIQYKSDKDILIETICSAKQIIYDTKNAYLRIYKNNERIYEDVPISRIISIKKLPTQKNPVEMTTTVVYKLKGRLAKVYNLKENEYIKETCPDGSKIIINKDEPINQLLKRLMRYDYDCTIISPKILRDEMMKMINDTLNNY